MSRYHARRLAFALIVASMVAIMAPIVTVAAALVQMASEPTTLSLWLAVLAVLTTVISSIILHFPQDMNPWVKRGIVAAISAVLAAVGIAYEGRLDTSDWSRTWLVVFLAATALYTLLMKPLQDTVKGNPQT